MKVPTFATSFSSELRTADKKFLWDGGHNLMYSPFKFFQSRWFGRVDLLLQPTTEKKVARCYVTSHPSPREVGSQPFTNNNSNVLRSAILQENLIFIILPSTNYWPDFLSQHCEVPFSIHGIAKDERTHNREFFFNHPVYVYIQYMLNYTCSFICGVERIAMTLVS